MTPPAVFVDVERPVRDWLRTQAITNIGARVYIGLPSDASFPALEITLLDGGIQPGETPLADALFSFSAWGENPDTESPDIQDAIWSLAALLQSTNHAALDSTLVLMGAQIVLGPVPRIDDDGTPRYLLDAALTVRVAA